MDFAGTIPVPSTSQTMFESAMRTVASNAVSAEEFEEFMSMVSPDQWRCEYCNRWFVTPSLARDCEARHERNE